MPKYRYVAISNDNQQLNGTIGAPDEKSARRELNELGLSVIQMGEIPEGEEVTQGPALPVFEFAGLDKNGKRVVGTIQSEDRLSAYKRLISEYAFNVEYVIDNSLDEAKKEAERLKGAFDLQSLVEEEAARTKKKETGEEKDLREFEKEQEVLKSQIDFVLNKVKEMLDAHEKNMKMETKEKIRGFVDKLMRIRTSTNLDYVRKTAEELLMFLQKEELFQNEDQHLKERTKLLVEAKSLTMQLKKSKSKTSISFGEQLRQWRKEHITNNPQPSFPEKALNFFIGIFIGFEKETENVENARKDIITLNNQIIQYLLLYAQAPNPEYKAETKAGLIRLLQERKKRKQILKEYKKSLRQVRREQGELSFGEKLRDDLFSFTGWLLAFYLIYYFGSIYLTTKDFGLPSVPYVFYIFKSSFLKYFLATLFLLHGAISVKVNFFRKSEVASLVIAPFFIFGSLLILINF
jgi:hypothetical protein